MIKMIGNGKIWPYAIGVAIIFIFGACVATIVVASKLPVEKSDTYMMDYHQADASANDLINAQIAFNKKYKIEYATQDFSQENSVIKYKITDKNGNMVDSANLKVVVTRPNSRKYDHELVNPKYQNGLYVFDPIKLELPGRWDVMVKVDIGEDQRYFNIKTDTRTKEYKEF